MTSLRLSDAIANDLQPKGRLVVDGTRGPAYQVDEIRVGWYAVPVSGERLLKDRSWLTAAAFVPCPFNLWGYTERPRLPSVEIDGIVQDNTLEAFHRIARWPIDRTEWMRKRGQDA